MSANSILGVIFDMDGVLVDSAAPHLQSWRQLAKENDSNSGSPPSSETGTVPGGVTDEQFAATFGRQNRDIIPILFGTVTDDRLASLADRKEEIYRDLIRENPPIVEGAVELVRSLQASGARLAVGSSGPRENIRLVLSAMGVADAFPVVISGDDVSRGKPDPQVFTLAAERLGIAPGQCVVIEDAPVGVDAAHSAGSLAVAISLYHPPETLQHANLVVAHLSDLTADLVLGLLDGGSRHGSGLDDPSPAPGGAGSDRRLQ